jgi:hypothetical protein
MRRTAATQYEKSCCSGFPTPTLTGPIQLKTPLPPWIVGGEIYPTIGRQCRLIETLGVKSLAGVYDTLSLNAHLNPVTLTIQYTFATMAAGRTGPAPVS